MEDLAGTAVRVTPERHRADEWAVVLAAGGIPHRLRLRIDGWALIVAAHDAEAAREALDAYDRENIGDTEVAADAVAPVRGAAAVGVAIGILLIGFFAITGTRASRSVWFERGGASAERIVAGEWWRTITALTLHADAPHLIGNAAASFVLVWAVSHQLGPGVGLWLLLLAGAGGNALTAVAHGAHHNSVGASTAMFGAIGILAATRVVSRGRRPVARKLWMVVAASLALLALLGTRPGCRPPRPSVRPLARRRHGPRYRARAAAASAPAGAVGARRGRPGVSDRRVAARYPLDPPTTSQLETRV